MKRSQVRLSALIGDLHSLAAETDAPQVARAGRLIDRDPARTWSQPELACHLDLTTVSLVRNFRAETGESPSAWLRRRRFAHAQSLIAQGLNVA